MRCYWHQMGQSMTTEQNKETKKNRRKFWSFQDLNISEKSKTDTSETPWCVPQLQKKNFIIQVLFVEVQTKGRYFLYFCSFVSSTHTMRTHTFTSRCHCKQKANGAKRSKAKKGFNAWQIQQHQEFLNLLFFLFSWCARAVVAPVDSLLRKPKLDLHF